MKVSRTDEQETLYRAAVSFAQDNLQDDIQARDHANEFSLALWKRCAEYGVLGWSVPKALGGSEYDVETTVHLMEALGYGCRDNGLCFGLGAQAWSIISTLKKFGTPDQIERYLKPVMQGQSLAAYAMTESGSGSDAFALSTTAVKDNDGYSLSGEKVLVTFAPIANFALVFATTNADAGQWGLSAFIVDADTPGYIAHTNEPKMGLRTIPFGKITLDNCRVPANALIGREGSGASMFNYSQGWERSLVLAPQLGTSQYLLETCVEFAKTRHRNGNPIAQHQSVSHKIANMAIKLEASRLLLYKTASLLQQGEHSLLEAAITKTFLSEAFVQASQDALTLHGGAGYVVQTDLERNLRDAIGGTLYGGTVDIQRNIIAGLLGL